MNEWTLAGEYLALIIIAIIALFFYDPNPLRSFKKRRAIYWSGLGLSFIAILLNIACVNVLEGSASFPVEVVIDLNSLYFFVTCLMTLVIGYYIFIRILEFVYDGCCLRRGRIYHVSMAVCYTLLLIYNTRSGIIFYVDDSGEYCRGVLHILSYIPPVGEVLIVLLCYLRNRKSVGKVTERLFLVAAPTAILLMALQFAFPDVQLNGTICALVNLIVFISYNGGRVEHDSVTGLEDRHYLATEINYRTGAHRDYQLILVKIGSLTKINHTYGEKGGNALLFTISSLLRELFADVRTKAEDGSRVFRYSDDTFALLFSDADQIRCTTRLMQTAKQMRRKFKLGNYEIELPFSIIELRYNGQNWSLDDISGYLNDAMLIAINENVEMLPFDRQLLKKRQRRSAIVKSMDAAIAEGRLAVYYQPIYYKSSGKFESAEALVRMFNERGEYISPGEFIPIAEENGAIEDITAFVLESVCRFLSTGAVPELNFVTVNVPIRQVEDYAFRKTLKSTLKKYNISPERIKIEITERDVEKNGHATVETMQELTEEGYRFVLDDFGIGYSNFSRVMSMPLDTVKLDRSLVLLELDERNLELIGKHFVPLFHSMGHRVIAEGVETAETAELILNCGVDCIQGFYYARPMPEERLIRWYQNL